MDVGGNQHPLTFTNLETSYASQKKKAKRKYSKASQTEVKNEMHRFKKGTAKSGKSGKGGKVKSKEQAIAIALSKARKKGKKAPKKKSAKKKSTK